MTDKQMKTYKAKCEIEYSQEYLPGRDITLVFEDTSVWSKNVNEEPEKFVVRERITGFYHGEPTEDGFKNYYTSGCEAVMYDELMEALTKTHGCVSKNEEEAFNMGQWLKDNGVTDEYAPKEEPKYDYAVVVYGGFDETPLVKYQRDYDNKDQAIMTYHDLEDTFRLEHKIFDNNTEEFIDQEECSAMAIIRIGAFDDEEVISFKSLLDKTNLSYNNDYKQIVDYLVENCKL
jgi:hypothetical protein